MRVKLIKQSYRSLLKSSLVLFGAAYCVSSVAGGIEMPEESIFTGLSVIAGVHAVALEPYNTKVRLNYLGSSGDDRGLLGTLQDEFNVPDSKFMANVAARAGFEIAKVFDPYGIYLGLNVNYLTGATWSRLASYDVTRTEVSSQGLTTITASTVTSVIELTINRVVNGLLKLGYVMNNRYLFYVQAGATSADVTWESHNVHLGGSMYHWMPGYAVGAGLEMALSKVIFFGIDYLFSDYKRVYRAQSGVIYSVSAGVNNATLINQIARTNFHTHRAGIYMRYMLNL